MASTTDARERAAASGDLDALARIRAEKRPRTAEVTVHLNHDLVDAYAEADRQLRLEREGTEEHARLSQLVDAQKRMLDESSVTLRFRGLGRKEYRELTAQHPPTDE